MSPTPISNNHQSEVDFPDRPWLDQIKKEETQMTEQAIQTVESTQAEQLETNFDMTALAWSDAKVANVMSYPDNEEYVTEYKEAIRLLFLI